MYETFIIIEWYVIVCCLSFKGPSYFVILLFIYFGEGETSDLFWLFV